MSQRTYSRIPLHKRVEAGLRMAQRSQTREKASEISTEMNISLSHLYLLEKKYNQESSMVDEEREGRPGKFDERFERRVIREIKKDPFQS